MDENYLQSKELQTNHGNNEKKSIGIGMDSAVVPLSRYPDLFLVQTVDFFYPLTDDPYLMGKIALANVVSDLYAVGIIHVDKIKMIISAPTEFTDKQRDTVVPKIINGFKDAAAIAKCTIDVQNVAINPWCIIGGIATSICHESEIIYPDQLQDGDVLILTKALGTQLASNTLIYWKDQSDEWKKLSAAGITLEDVKYVSDRAVEQMCFLNVNAAELMHKYNAHGATDITGFGLLGHANNLAAFQKKNLTLVINTLPIIGKVKQIAEVLGRTQKLFNGLAVETSGGLLIGISRENATKFCEDYNTSSHHQCWIVGFVKEGEKIAKVSSNVKILEV